MERRLANKVSQKKVVRASRPSGNCRHKQRPADERRVVAAFLAAKKNCAVQRRRNRASKEAKLESNLVTVRRVVEQPSPAPGVMVVPAQKESVEDKNDSDLCVSEAPLPFYTPISINENIFTALVQSRGRHCNGRIRPVHGSLS